VWQTNVSEKELVEMSESFFVDPEYREALDGLGLTCVDAVFSFEGGERLTKKNLAVHRSRVRFDIDRPQRTLFLKRYDSPPIAEQLANWVSNRRRASSSSHDLTSAAALQKMGIATPKTVAYGEQWGVLFEKRSFIITQKIPDAESLEQKLPHCFMSVGTRQDLRSRKDFIHRLAGFIRRFHNTGYRHRDLYLAHIFHASSGKFYLIDLARCFRPALFAERFRVKDIAQLYYSAPALHFSATDRLRFYLRYIGCEKIRPQDKAFIRRVLSKANRMARHNRKHGRPIPFAS
jgi:heptose I phosphotransferase